MTALACLVASASAEGFWVELGRIAVDAATDALTAFAETHDMYSLLLSRSVGTDVLDNKLATLGIAPYPLFLVVVGELICAERILKVRAFDSLGRPFVEVSHCRFMSLMHTLVNEGVDAFCPVALVIFLRCGVTHSFVMPDRGRASERR